MKNLLLRAATTATLILALTATAHADPHRVHGGAGEDHDSGFLARLSIGVGFNTSTFDVEPEITASGLGGFGSIALGGIVAPNLAINADLFGMNAIDPTFELGGQEQETDNVTLSVGAIGVGVTYYVMPLNLYVAGSIGAAVGTLEIETAGGTLTGETEIGFAVNVMIGKEWWVSSDWGLGVAGQFIFASLPGDVEDTSMTAIGFGVLFSATYN